MKHLKFFPAFIMLFFTFSCLAQKSSVLKPPKDFKKKLVFIPSGYAINKGDTALVNAFWFSKYEISNAEYVEFLDDLLKQGRTDDLIKALPDTLQWRNIENAYMEPFVENYLRHPAYRHYPVVNISHEAALLYCKWLTEKANRNSKSSVVYEFRLPTHNEWLSASQGGKDRPFAWNTESLKDNKGRELANYKGNDTFITVPVSSYFPGSSGLYNMNGNVAEMLNEKGIAAGGSWNCSEDNIKNTSVLTYENASPFVGFRIIMTIIKTES